MLQEGITSASETNRFFLLQKDIVCFSKGGCLCLGETMSLSQDDCVCLSEAALFCSREIVSVLEGDHPCLRDKSHLFQKEIVSVSEGGCPCLGEPWSLSQDEIVPVSERGAFLLRFREKLCLTKGNHFGARSKSLLFVSERYCPRLAEMLPLPRGDNVFVSQ